ncbi:hypothetical protein ABIB62_000643 [Mucilaginibacter sp. UYP25]|uniref:hypothetical protein n=1 Tax=unclassified Mucilaginibacter TaxID=2617802 RepID=UPI0033968F58
MKVIINNINIYHIHDIKFNGGNNSFNINSDKIGDADLSKFYPTVVVNENINNNDHPLIAQLEACILQSEREKKQLLDQLHNESNDNL